MRPESDPSKVTLEDLLRLKRAERPSAEFWTSFEQELRAKQLAALVQYRPWWSVSWARIRTSMIRVVAPLGAGAALALTFLSINWVAAPELAKLPATHVTVATIVTPPAPVGGTEVAVAQPPAPVTNAAEVNSTGADSTAPATMLAADTTANNPTAITTPVTQWTLPHTDVNLQTVAVASIPLPTLDTPSIATLASVTPATTLDVSKENMDKAEKSGLVHPLTVRMMAALRPAEMNARPVFASDTRTSESESHTLNEDLLTNDNSSRRIVSIGGSGLRVTF